ncbi:hypothetical protein QJS10_CPA10g00816 [Acorus calamus]|uniref:HMA domain-containing protein n=1 Tax=Acorus calamus TaxID=4465 RepID=A0AAV9DXB7_ACOCL|nr:hypothetical protein QJS10_CPA10g00816 [Acorus calamus]
MEVGGMMCGGCAARVKTVLSSDDRVETAAVNMVTETVAVRLRRSDGGGDEAAVVGEDLARWLTECGFLSKRRVSAGGVGENVRKWREMAEKKEELKPGGVCLDLGRSLLRVSCFASLAFD